MAGKIAYRLRNGKKLMMEPPYSHDPYKRHFRISPAQAKKVRAMDIPQGWWLYVIPVDSWNPDVCPHCQGSAEIIHS